MRSVVLGVLLICLVEPSLRGQQAPEETLVVTANAYPTALGNLSRSVVVITREQIESLPVTSAAELLRLVAGVEVRSRGPFGIQSDYSIRGATFGQALVLIDGVRLNDSQSGHHNGDIPLPLEAIERVEILLGPGSSLHGADAFGGTIHFITRKPSPGKSLRLSGGEHGLLEASGRFDFVKGGYAQSVSAFGNRSSGFMFARDFRTGGFSTRVESGSTRFFAGHVSKDFGANGFYGNSPSHEKTHQTVLSVRRPLLQWRGWNLESEAFYRTHGDHFLWDVRRPGFFENRHRTHAAAGGLKGRIQMSDRLHFHFGSEFGRDWIRSNNLGDHAFSRTAAFAELAWQPSLNVSVYPGVRWDYYSHFDSALSPSISAAWRLSPHVRLRGSAGHAFRAPTFTELYYRDPNHQAAGSLQPETAWSLEGGLDWTAAAGHLVDWTVFSRWEDDVIDWVRSRPSEKWTTTNIRHVRTQGIEAGWKRILGSGLIGVQYAYLNSDAGAVAFLSKYALDFARHNLAGSAALSLPAGLQLGQVIRYTRRSDGRDYWVWDARLSRSFGEYTVFLEGFNLLDRSYQEIRGVEMPGRWVRAGLEIR